MPTDDPDQQTRRKPPAYDEQEIDRLVAYVASLGSGPPIPDIDPADGDLAEGQQLYAANCGKCHQLFADGGKVGPDLTGYKRDDVRGMLLSVVNPSAEIREGFENYIVRTADGRTLTGLIVDQDSNVVVLRGADGQNVSLARDDVEGLRASRQSLMPDGQLKPMSEQQIRDLFAYLRSTQPLP